MKILMLGWELPPHNSGGLGVACFQLCKALALQGVELDFVVPYQDKHDAIDFMNIIPALPYSASELQGAYDSAKYGTGSDQIPYNLRDQQHQYTKAVQNIAAANDYDAVHAHDWLTFEAAVQTKLQHGKPLIAFLDSMDLHII